MTRSSNSAPSVAKDGTAINVSRRLPRDLRPSALSQALAGMATPYDLTVSNPTRVGLTYDHAAIAAAMARASDRRYDPDARGVREARAVLAHRLGVADDRLVVTASTSEAYAIAVKTFVDPGGLVAAPRPSYPLIAHLAELEGASLVTYSLDADDFDVDRVSLGAALSAGAKLVCVISPNNPTGSVLGADALYAIADMCAAHAAPLVIDRVFSQYGVDGVVPPLPRDLAGLVIELDGLSKRAALPQLKLAWMAVHGAAAAAAIDALSWTNDAYLSTAGPVQYALEDLLALGEKVAAQIRERLRINVAALRVALQSVPAVQVMPVTAGWSAVIRVPCVVDEDAWVLALARAGVRVQPGYLYDFVREGYLVVSLLPDSDTFARAVVIIADACGAMV